MSTGAPDIDAILNDTGGPATPSTSQPSAEVTEARSKKLSIEDIERIREETAAEQADAPTPAQQRPLDPIERWERGL